LGLAADRAPDHGAASFRILVIRGGEWRVGRWATGRSLTREPQVGTCALSVLGRRNGKTLPLLIVLAYARLGAVARR